MNEDDINENGINEDGMNEDNIADDNASTRRSFLKGSAFLAAPIAAVALPAVVPAVALADDDGLKARVERLEDEAAIRDLHQVWLRQVNAGERDASLYDAVLRIMVDHAGAPDRIEIAGDGLSAVGNFDCAVEAETPLAKDCTLAQMAHAQGNGSIRRRERRLLTVDYKKTRGTWGIAKVVSRRL